MKTYNQLIELIESDIHDAWVNSIHRGMARTKQRQEQHADLAKEGGEHSGLHDLISRAYGKAHDHYSKASQTAHDPNIKSALHSADTALNLWKHARRAKKILRSRTDASSA